MTQQEGKVKNMSSLLNPICFIWRKFKRIFLSQCLFLPSKVTMTNGNCWQSLSSTDMGTGRPSIHIPTIRTRYIDLLYTFYLILKQCVSNKWCGGGVIFTLIWNCNKKGFQFHSWHVRMSKTGLLDLVSWLLEEKWCTFSWGGIWGNVTKDFWAKNTSE